MKKIALLILLAVSEFGFSQLLVQKINSLPDTYQPKTFIADSVVYNLLAVLVEFDADKDAATYGTGKFGSHYSKSYGDTIIDPLPHNRAYFENHLLFLSNYYRKVSNGKVIINFHVLDKIVELPEVMSKYSPPAGSSDLKNLGKLFEEAWKKADSLNPGFDFFKYDVFTIFHAGVGRDIKLTENFNLEKDIPSIFLNLKTLKQFFGSAYDGVNVGTPSFKITNSMIIPETESREVFTIGGTALLELSINGLLAASFASFLGLPDLFDTKTGLTAIGRFGLMDGQAMFNYGGLFPPEPSAWEKWYLGWVQFNEYNLSQTGMNVLASLTSAERKNTVIKIPINPYEYFLVENRQRDVVGNGAKVKTVINGSVIEKVFLKDTVGFNYYLTYLVDGVVIDVDEFDWALPGSGILIWHIDEKVIASKIQDNTINADKNNRGIDLEEADGIQDIGVEFKTYFGDVVVGDGEPVDFWFKGNSARLYKNEFSDRTLPDAKSNSGASSFIKLSNFSGNGNRMTFDLTFGSDEVKPIYRYKITEPSTNVYLFPNKVKANRIYYAKENWFGYYDKVEKQNVALSNALKAKPLRFYLIDSRDHTRHDYYVYTERNKLNIAKLINDDSLRITSFNFPDDQVGNNLIASEYKDNVVIAPFGSLIINFDDVSGNLYNFSLNDSTIRKYYSGYSQILDIAANDRLVFITENKLKTISRSFNLSFPNPLKIGILVDNHLSEISLGGVLLRKTFDVVLYKNNLIEIFGEDGKSISIAINSPINVTSFTIGDIKNDGNNYIIVNAGDKILAYNKNGNLAANFPIYHPTRKNFKRQIYLADLNDDKTPDLLIESEDGQLLCFDPLKGKILENYSISLGVGSNNSSVLVNEEGKLYYHTVSDSGWYQVFQIASSEKGIAWNGLKGNFLSQNSSRIPQSKINVKEFFPKNLVYNWPNPVYNGKTNIRYYVSQDSKINIRIYDLAGAFVAELNNSAKGGIESETVWDVSNIQSGIYLARVEAVAGTKKDFAIIKIAVVK
jgi:hypothetical protein